MVESLSLAAETQRPVCGVGPPAGEQTLAPAHTHRKRRRRVARGGPSEMTRDGHPAYHCCSECFKRPPHHEYSANEQTFPLPILSIGFTDPSSTAAPNITDNLFWG